ncbi:hypothetical protein LEP1GSC061_1991 [Leptospira wolffii serovar Khorat str. Khorat-H2]|nr:hypothetical protein LEP1GSC061_1991 [Leptospira wolffii serovar Khorat str. Khorat-H2]
MGSGPTANFTPLFLGGDFFLRFFLKTKGEVADIPKREKSISILPLQTPLLQLFFL